MTETQTTAPPGPLAPTSSAAERLVARRQLPVGRPDLPARQPAAARAAAPRARQAAPARATGAPRPGLNFVYAHLNRVIRAQRPRRDLRHRARATAGPGLVASTYLEGTYSEVYPSMTRDEEGLRAAVPPVLLPGRHPQPRRAGDAGLDPRGRRARLRAGRTPTERRSTTPTCSCAASWATARPRPARWRRAGTPTSSSTRRATARCSRSCTSTATRSPTRPCWRASRTTSCARCSSATATSPTSSRATTRRRCTSSWPRRSTRWSSDIAAIQSRGARGRPPSGRAGR